MGLKSCAHKPIKIFLFKSKRPSKLGRVRQVNVCEFEAILSYRVRPCPGKKQKTKNKHKASLAQPQGQEREANTACTVTLFSASPEQAQPLKGLWLRQEQWEKPGSLAQLTSDMLSK